jgi:hypothetical protein
MNYGDLLQSAYSAANNAANAENARLGPEASRGFDCGFAWVDIETPRGKTSPETLAFVKYCKTTRSKDCGKARGFGKSAWQFWSPAHAATQSISVHYAGAAAFALVLRNAGIETAQAGQRLD